MILVATFSIEGIAQKKKSTQQRIQDLEEQVKKLSENQKELEARVIVLEKTNSIPSPDIMHQNYVRASRDAIISAVVNIAANAYQYKIRPTTMGGGGGVYAGYKIPKTMMSNEVATFEATASEDSVIVKGTWTKGSGTVQCTSGKDGRTGGWIYTGDFE
jgi:cell division septum initiation protein DivIVA